MLINIRAYMPLQNLWKEWKSIFFPFQVHMVDGYSWTRAPSKWSFPWDIFLVNKFASLLICLQLLWKSLEINIFFVQRKKLQRNIAAIFFTKYSMIYFWQVPETPLLFTYYRSSHRRCSVKNGVLKYFQNFTGKHFQACNVIKKGFQQKYFPAKCAEFLGTHILKNILERLLLLLSCVSKTM